MASIKFFDGEGLKHLWKKILGTFETQSHASSTYETKSNASSTYETKSNASSTYETKSHASSTYQPKGNYAGSASDKGSATSAVKLDTSTAGAIDGTPVYFTGGKPAAMTSINMGSGAISTTGKITAGSIKSSGNIDATGHTVTATSFAGKATSAVTADKATTATTATKLSTDGGNTKTPVYFTGGKPSAVTSLDATILTGMVPIESIPHSARERLVIVENDAARLKLTTEQVQTGDTVKVTETGKMYFVKDDSKLTSEAGYEIYTAGAASSAAEADKLTTSAGSATTPVYFSGGKPVAITSYSGKASTAGTADKAKALDVSSAIGSLSKPVYIDASGKPVAITSYSGKANTAGTADKAVVLTTTTAGAIDGTPVYFTGGKPAAMTSINMDKGDVTAATFHGALDGKASTAGTADTANAVAWSNVSGKPTSIALTGDVTGSANIAAGKVSIATALRSLTSSDIPVLDASKITTGSFATARIPDLSASKITSDTFNAARIPALDAGKITTGVFDGARIPKLTVDKIPAHSHPAFTITNKPYNATTSGQTSASAVEIVKYDAGQAKELSFVAFTGEEIDALIEAASK